MEGRTAPPEQSPKDSERLITIFRSKWISQIEDKKNYALWCEGMTPSQAVEAEGWTLINTAADGSALAYARMDLCLTFVGLVSGALVACDVAEVVDVNAEDEDDEKYDSDGFLNDEDEDEDC